MRKQAEAVQVSKRPRMSTMWPEEWDSIADMDQLKHGPGGKLAEEDLVMRERAFVDADRLSELVMASEAGSFQMASLVKQYERKQANAVQMLRQQLESLQIQRIEAELKHRLIVEGTWGSNGLAASGRPDGHEFTSPMDEDEMSNSALGSAGSSAGSINSPLYDDSDRSVDYWRERAKTVEHLLAESLQREQVLLIRLRETDVQPKLSAQVQELKEVLQRWDNFLHLTLLKAPVVIGHQDTDLRYRFIFNPLPGLQEDAILGKTDSEILQGQGVEDVMELKREVLKWGRPLQREIRFQTDLIDDKTFLISVEPVFSKSQEILGVNYVAIDVTGEALRREKLVILREEGAMQKAMETELNRSLVVTEEAMRAKQMLATMSHEIRSPLSGVVSMAQVLARTKLDAEQRSMVDVMTSSGDHVLELINDILDLSKAESGAMKLEAKKFRPRQVVKHVIQLSTASVQDKNLSLKGTVQDDVPIEVVGDVLRIRQVLTNLVSNAIKFTHDGMVEIEVRMAAAPVSSSELTKSDSNKSGPLANVVPSTPVKGLPSTFLDSRESEGDEELLKSSSLQLREGPTASTELSYSESDVSRTASSLSTASTLSTVSTLTTESSSLSSSSSISVRTVDDGKSEEDSGPLSTFPGDVWDLSPKSYELSEEIWIHCEVRDTGIGIPETALPSLFDQYTQATTTTARKYGGTGLGLAICKQLIGLMGGTLEVKSKLDVGSCFSFHLPLRAVKDKTSQEPSSGDGSPIRPVVKGPKLGNGKLQMLRESKRSWTNALGESTSAGGSKVSAEKPIPKVPSLEATLDSSSSDGAASSSTKCSLVESADATQKCGALNPKPVSTALPAGKPSLPRRNPNSLKKPTSPLKSALKLPPTGAHGEPRQRRLPKILLAEDNKVNVVVAQSMMKRLGHLLEVVNNGAEAVKALQRNEYDLVLMDVSMPIMDGLEATRCIRKFEETGQWENRKDQSAVETSVSPSVTFSDVVVPTQHPEVTRIPKPSSRQKTPIIAMTANAMAENVAECYNNGMDSFIAKPVTFEKLEQVLKQYLPWLETNRAQTG